MRKRAGLTQKNLADVAGVSQALIVRIEAETVDTRLGTLRRLLSALHEHVPSHTGPPTLSDLMSSPVTHCRASDTIRHVVKLMQDSGISQMPVMENSLQVGSITDSCLLKALSKKKTGKNKVSDVMQRPFPLISATAPLDKAMHLLSHNSAVLVTRNSVIVGIITKADALRLVF